MVMRPMMPPMPMNIFKEGGELASFTLPDQDIAGVLKENRCIGGCSFMNVAALGGDYGCASFVGQAFRSST
jgi:hypothetical protein